MVRDPDHGIQRRAALDLKNVSAILVQSSNQLDILPDDFLAGVLFLIDFSVN